MRLHARQVLSAARCVGIVLEPGAVEAVLLHRAEQSGVLVVGDVARGPNRSGDGTATEVLLTSGKIEGGLGAAAAGSGELLLEFLRATIRLAEEVLGLHDYHLRVVRSQRDLPAKFGLARSTPALEAAAERAGLIACLVGDSARTTRAPRAPSLEAFDSPIAYTDGSGKEVELGLRQSDICVAEGDAVRVFLDAQARPLYVSTLTRFVRRQSELTDAELLELWQLPIAQARSALAAAPRHRAGSDPSHCARRRSLAAPPRSMLVRDAHPPCAAAPLRRPPRAPAAPRTVGSTPGASRTSRMCT